ncbi:unnamed protein product [Clonostachys rhizophaga]|uniref:Kri1-like C-terminal domain-containing protein n=1 Tax=Clonostachys rhizophaga TaxID=160324 RepID=A0A9N9VS05_9HYPO|nr:unnamed protein product [Clonostachys rhizophaga]
MGSSAPAKRKLLDDSDSDSDDGGAQIQESGFKVNEEYARRFEHNKKREELHRLEEKYKKDASRKNANDEDDESSTDESEDEDGFLATEDLDAQISATLQAIKNKDPRVYDKDVTFYKEGDANAAPKKEKKEKPVYLKDYHREKFMRGDVGADDDDEEAAPATFAQEQDELKKSIVSEMHNADAENEGSDSDGDDFMKRKEPAKVDNSGVHPARAKKVKKQKAKDLDVEGADRDPETFLSNFLSARAWLPGDDGEARWKAFESDDDEEENKADEFEQAYNMRFEDPEKSNEVLKSYARDITAARSVRREDKTGRARRRELEKEQKEAEKREKREDKARLRKLKLEETEQKLRKVRQAAGAIGAELKDEDWMKFLDDAWENDKWEEEMSKRFGEDYYAMDDAEAPASDEEGAEEKKRKHPKKPKWDDDIDIKDLVPDFDDEEAQPKITLSDGEGQEPEDDNNDDEEGDEPPAKKRKSAKEQKRERLESQKQARKDRTKLEALVDSKLELTHHDLLSQPAAAAAHAPFRYRETSPQSFGMTARDILLAPSDSALNDFAGLKKLATFRDEEKKRRDRKRLNKKARLRQWRRDTFGREFEQSGPTYGFEKFAAEAEAAGEARLVAPEAKKESSNIVGEVGESKKKRKRSKGKKNGDGETAEA